MPRPQPHNPDFPRGCTLRGTRLSLQAAEERVTDTMLGDGYVCYYALYLSIMAAWSRSVTHMENRFSATLCDVAS